MAVTPLERVSTLNDNAVQSPKLDQRSSFKAPANLRPGSIFVLLGKPIPAETLNENFSVRP